MSKENIYQMGGLGRIQEWDQQRGGGIWHPVDPECVGRFPHEVGVATGDLRRQVATIPSFTPPTCPWISRADRPPTEADGYCDGDEIDQGYILGWDSRDGVECIPWNRTYGSHWMPIPKLPAEARLWREADKAAAAWDATPTLTPRQALADLDTRIDKLGDDEPDPRSEDDDFNLKVLIPALLHDIDSTRLYASLPRSVQRRIAECLDPMLGRMRDLAADMRAELTGENSNNLTSKA